LGNLGSSKPGSKIQDLATLLEKSWVLDPRIQDSWAVLAPGNLDLGSTEPRFLGQDPQDILDLGSAKMDSPDFRKISPDFRKISPDFRKTSPDLSGKGLDTAKPIENIGLGGYHVYVFIFTNNSEMHLESTSQSSSAAKSWQNCAGLGGLSKLSRSIYSVISVYIYTYFCI
jgi:hypothetical protein